MTVVLINVLRTKCRTLAAILAKILSVRTSQPSTSWSRRSREHSTWTMGWGQIILMTSIIIDKDNGSCHIGRLWKYQFFSQIIVKRGLVILFAFQNLRMIASTGCTSVARRTLSSATWLSPSSSLAASSGAGSSSRLPIQEDLCEVF